MLTFEFVPKRKTAPKGAGHVRIRFENGNIYAHTEQYSSRKEAMESTLSCLTQIMAGEAEIVDERKHNDEKTTS